MTRNFEDQEEERLEEERRQNEGMQDNPEIENKRQATVVKVQIFLFSTHHFIIIPCLSL